MAVDVGPEADGVGTAFEANYTVVYTNNPANADGIIDTVEVWAETSLVNCVVGTFYLISGTTLKCRDSVVLGAVASGAKRTFSELSLTIREGDFIGIYCTGGKLLNKSSGGSGYYFVSGEYIDPGDETSYSQDGGFDGSGNLYGTGEEAAPPLVTTSPVTEVEEETAIGNGNITDTGGENCDHRGIVYGKISKGDPGNTAPELSGYDDYEDESNSFGIGAFTRSLTGLDPGTKYYARAYAHNSSGYSYGDEVEFTTLILTVTIQPMTDILPPTAKAHGTITLLGGTPCTQHGHCWATSPDPTIADNKTELGAVASAPHIFESTLTGVLLSITYYVRAYATDGKGTKYSAEISFVRYGPWRDEAALPFSPTGQIFFSPIIGDEVYVIDQGYHFYKYNLKTREWTELASPNYGSDAASRSRFFRTLAISPDGTKLACSSEGEWSTSGFSTEWKTGGGRRVEIYDIDGDNWTASKQTDFLIEGEWVATRALVWEDNDTLWVWCIKHVRTASGWGIKCAKYVIATDTWTAYTGSFQDIGTAYNGLHCGNGGAAIKADKSIIYGGGTGSVDYQYTKYTIATDDYSHTNLGVLSYLFVHAYDRDKIWYYDETETCQQGYVDIEDDSHDDQFPENPDRDAEYGKYCGIRDDLRRIIAHARISEDGGTELMSYTPKGMAGLNPALMEVLGY